MNPYEYINHIVDDCISDVNKDFGHIFFKDNIRYQHVPHPKWDSIQPDLYKVGDELAVPHVDRWGNSSSLTDLYIWWLGFDEAGSVDYLYSKNANIYLEHQWEPIYFSLDKKFWDSIYHHILQGKGKFHVLHSEKNSKDVKSLERIGVTPVHWFGHAYLCSKYYFNNYKDLNVVINYTNRSIEHKWICANRLIDKNRSYRLHFLNKLDLDTGVYSLLNKDPQTSRTPNEIMPNNTVDVCSFDDHVNSSAEINFLQDNSWLNSFLHVVSETIWQDKIHFTEKVFKPIVLHQPFVVLQAPGSLEYLHSYGFKTFGDWWDESYDTIEDPNQRMQAIANIVNWIGSKSLNELETMRTEMASVLEYNFRHFYENIPAICIDELRANLTP